MAVETVSVSVDCSVVEMVSLWVDSMDVARAGQSACSTVVSMVGYLVASLAG